MWVCISGEDGTFNLLEYADDLALDTALDEEHDKSIFDEHLGIANEVAAGSTVTSSAASTTAQHKASAPAVTTATATTAATAAATGPPATATTAASQVATAATTETASATATTAAPKPSEEIKSESATSGLKVKTEEEPNKTKIVPPPLPKVEQIPSPPEKTPGSASSDFQAKFLEFSQRGKPPKEGADVKTEKGAAEEGASKSASDDAAKETTKDVPQLDGVFDQVEEDDDDAYDADDEYTLPQLDGWFDDDDDDDDDGDDDEVCQIMQVDGAQ